MLNDVHTLENMKLIRNYCRNFMLLIVVLVCCFVSSCTIKEPATPDKSIVQIGSGQSWRAVQCGQKERWYLLYVPTAYDNSTPFPLVFNFHGSRSNPIAQLNYSDFKSVAEKKGFMAVFPFGEYNRNLGLNSWNTADDSDGVDDVEFVRIIIDDLSKTFSIDSKRIYATGFSGGARMVSKLACELDGILAAVAPVAGIQFPAICQAFRAVPIIAFHGKQDAVNTYVHSSDSRAYWNAGVEDALSGWVEKFECNQYPRTEKMSDTVTKIVWEKCRNGAAINFYRIDDGGHTWPGSSIVLTQPWSGITNKDIIASELILEFFKAQPLP